MKSPSTKTSEVPGWYGKLPVLGDFAGRRLSDEFVQAWDDWLQQGLAFAQGLGQTAARDIVPHRFWIGPRVLTDAGWAGVLVPSADRIGRRFPLTVAAPCLAEPIGLAAALAASNWYAAIEDIAQQAVRARLPIERLERALAAVAATQALAGAVDRDAATLADKLLQSLPASAGAVDKVTKATGLPACSVWWHGTPELRSQVFCVAGLPPAAQFESLLLAPAEPLR